MQSKREVRHEFGLRGQTSNADAVHEKMLVEILTGGNNRGGVVAADFRGSTSRNPTCEVHRTEQGPG